MWAAILISRFIRFILEEDILTRMDLPRGVPATISRLGYYVLVTIGTLFAFSAAGVALDRLSLLAGAFGVGIGFGLQDVVNNFVSGLILMFERPIKEGDKIEFGTKTGQVTHIGIRSSIVRTWDGADVNVPNSRLISNEVTNWTLNNELRRIDLSIKVEYDTDPLLVNEILLRVAKEHEQTIEDPPPEVVFMGFGENSLDFSLRAWSSGEFSWLTIRSELYFSVYRELAAAGIKIPVPRRDVRMQTED